MCEAEDRNLRALFVLENDWGCGRIDIGRIKRILQGDEDGHLKDWEEHSHARTG